MIIPEPLKTTAEELVRGCREGYERENLDKLYAPNAVSVEAYPNPDQDTPETAGLDGIKGKHDWWEATFEETTRDVQGPFFHGGDRFSVYFATKAKNKNTGETLEMTETATYHVDQQGRIVREEFFWRP